jgi:hypothetical protein
VEEQKFVDGRQNLVVYLQKKGRDKKEQTLEEWRH